MAQRTLEQRLADVRSADPSAAAGVEELRGALRATTGVLIAAAAKRVAEHELRAVAERELAGAYQRLLERAVQRDPGCRGKIAIARCLHTLDHWEDGVFVHGVTYVQREPVWGGTVDTAAELRGVCGLAHAHFHRGDALDVLAALLADPERMARAAAAQALGDSGRPDAAALVRFKLLTGDPEPEVLSAACESLVALQRAAAVPFLAALLAHPDDRAECAALALGGARLPAAVAPVLAWARTCGPEPRRRVAYLALALARTDDATAYLVEVVATGVPPDAIAAARALATFKDDPAIRRALDDAAAAQRDRTARAEIRALLA